MFNTKPKTNPNQNPNEFLKEENLNVLWEIIVDEYIHDKPNDFCLHILKTFQENLLPFYENERKINSNLIDMNKKYIVMIIHYIKNNLHSVTKQNLNPKPTHNPNQIKNENLQNNLQNNIQNNIKIKAQNKEFITNEEIQNNRQNIFERDLSQRQEEFTNSMNITKPPVPNFSIKIEDEPIVEIEKTIKEMIAQRNYDIDIINKSNESKKNISPESWLKPEETSIKSEQLQKKTNINNNANTNSKNTNNTNNSTNNSTNNNITTIQDTENKLKYIKIEKTELDSQLYKNQIIDLNKRITWEDETLITDLNKDNFTRNPWEENEPNIFEKLKTVNQRNSINQDQPINPNYNLNYNPNINIMEEKIAVIQNDILLLNIKMTNIDNNIKTLIEKFNKIE